MEWLQGPGKKKQSILNSSFTQTDLTFEMSQFKLLEGDVREICAICIQGANQTF